jgi:hypothetical protein
MDWEFIVLQISKSRFLFTGQTLRSVACGIYSRLTTFHSMMCVLWRQKNTWIFLICNTFSTLIRAVHACTRARARTHTRINTMGQVLLDRRCSVSWSMKSHSLWNPNMNYYVHKSPALNATINRWVQFTFFPSCFLKIHYNNMNLCLGLPTGLFLSGFWLKFCTRFSFPPCILHVLISLIIFGNKYKLRCSSCNFPRNGSRSQ